jgi:pimeloyl-ACP methyl ester carboxylesterase
LQDDLEITAFDLPSHGKSADWDGQGDLNTLCLKMAKGVLDQRMDVIGHSYGATVALRLAVEHPHLVRSLTLIEPVYFAVTRHDTPTRFATHREEASPFEAALSAGDHTLSARLFNRLWGDGTPWADIPANTQEYMIERMPFVAGQGPMIYDDNAGLLAPGALNRVSMPCVLVNGGDSLDITDAINQGLVERLPNAYRREINGAGHMVPITHPDKVATVIAELLEMAEE